MNVFKKIKQRGQILLLYALIIPMLFFFVGITFDLSWYYLNVARMQNAADAAVLAGAQTLIEREETLSDYNYTTFINSFDGSNAYESSRGTYRGDKIAKTYIGKNMSAKNSSWESDTMTDLFTRKDLHFSSTLLGDNANSETLYYHVMLEQEVPHMMLGKFFPDMNAKVSSVAKITQFMKGYDLFYQMKHLASKQTYASSKELAKEKGETSVEARSALFVLRDNIEDNRYTETVSLPDENYLFDNLFIGTDTHSNISKSSSDILVNQYYQMYREINIDKVYAVRNATFYKDSSVLSNVRGENFDYEDLSDDELAQLLAKDSCDPLYVRIESEASGEAVRQIIINVNVANTEKNTDRPIILFYDGPANDESLPVILNLNADFRGVLYAPNSPVVINGNGYSGGDEHYFQGFVIAKNFIKLETNLDPTNYHAITVENITGDELDNVIMFVDNAGRVQFDYEEVKDFSLSTFRLAGAEFDSFNLVNYKAPHEEGKANNLFTAETAAELLT